MTTPSIPTTAPDLSRYLAIHQAMRDSNDRLVAGLENLQPGDPRRTAALARWFDGYAGELRHHHAVEDSIFFPALSARVPVFRDFDAVIVADHHRVDELLEQISGALRSRRHDDARSGALQLRDLLLEHLDLEDRDVLPLFRRHFTVEEYDGFDAAAIKTATPKQLLFTVPWWMDTIEPSVAARDKEHAPLALRTMYYATRGWYARLTRRAFGG